MALRFLLAKTGSRVFNGGGELKVKNPIGLLSGVLTSKGQSLRSGNSVRPLCKSSLRYTSTSSSSDSESNRRSEGENLDPSRLTKIQRNWLDDTRFIAGGGHWEVALEMPEVIEAADVAVKLYNDQQNAKLQLVGLVKAYRTLEAGWWFELTLEAVDRDTGEKNEYEACVWIHATNKFPPKLSYLKFASDKS